MPAYPALPQTLERRAVPSVWDAKQNWLPLAFLNSDSCPLFPGLFELNSTVTFWGRDHGPFRLGFSLLEEAANRLADTIAIPTTK